MQSLLDASFFYFGSFRINCCFSYEKTVLKVIVNIFAMLIGAEDARLLREYGTRRLPELPAESEAPGAEINMPI
ncbi:hypothetical protein [Neobacillus drentensis]|uniref:hypothetical protein n=1 Tax=Neobacillus drentensis TaxID=220684 RepID=UPI003001BABE